MSEPRRLLEQGTDLERLLLSAGRSARPGRMAKARAAVLVSLSGVGVVRSAEAAGAGGSLRPWLAAKWVAVGLGAGAVAFTVVRATHHPAHGTATTVGAIATIPADWPIASTAVPAPIQPGEAATDLSPAVAQAAPSANNPADPGRKERAAGETRAVRESAANGLSGEEIAEIDAARRAVEAGNPRSALERLDRYAKNHPNGALEQEHLRLRIEALAALGELDAARVLLRRFLVRYPQSAHRKRLLSLVGGAP